MFNLKRLANTEYADPMSYKPGDWLEINKPCVSNGRLQEPSWKWFDRYVFVRFNKGFVIARGPIGSELEAESRFAPSDVRLDTKNNRSANTMGFKRFAQLQDSQYAFLEELIRSLGHFHPSSRISWGYSEETVESSPFGTFYLQAHFDESTNNMRVERYFDKEYAQDEYGTSVQVPIDWNDLEKTRQSVVAARDRLRTANNMKIIKVSESVVPNNIVSALKARLHRILDSAKTEPLEQVIQRFEKVLTTMEQLDGGIRQHPDLIDVFRRLEKIKQGP